MTSTVLVTEELRDEAASVTSQLPPDEALNLQLVVHTDRGRDDRSVEIPDELAKFLRGILDALVTNDMVRVGTFPELVTTTVAAHLLGVSRPTLMKFVSDGRIPATKVGTHTRLRVKDVMAFSAKRRAEQAEAFDEMRRIEDELDLDTRIGPAG